MTVDDRVLLVDANFGDPALRRAFESAGLREAADRADGDGLAEWLDATATGRQAITASGFPTLDLLDAGSSAVAASDLLASRRFARFCAAVAADYDLVVVDFAALDEAHDAESAAPALDGLILVESDDASTSAPRSPAAPSRRVSTACSSRPAPTPGTPSLMVRRCCR